MECNKKATSQNLYTGTARLLGNAILPTIVGLRS